MRLFRTTALATAALCLAAGLSLAQSGRKPRGGQTPAAGGGSQNENKREADGGGQGTRRADDERGVYAGREVTQRAVVRTRPEPVYPPGARRYGVEGVVRLRIVLGADGAVRDRVEVQKSLPYGVTEACIEAAKRIKFEPAQRDGRPVSQYLVVEYNIRLH